MKRSIVFSALLSAISLYSLPSHASGMIKGESSYVSSDYAKTKYPILLSHGLLGFSRLGSSTFGMDYWYQILPDLARNGATVYATQVSPVNSTEFRGEQLLQQIDEVIAITGQPKVNLIGHSHGGPTIQYIEGVAPEKVASLTAVAGAMRGAKLADMLGGNAVTRPPSQIILGVIGEIIKFAEGNTDLPTNAEGALNSLTTSGAAKFNAKYGSAAIPKDCSGSGQKITSNGIYHYSWMGNAQVTNIFDVLDTTLTAASTLLLGSTATDGILETCTGNYGQIIRNDYKLNHFDEVNMVLGLRGFMSQDPVAIFRQHANRLKSEGL